MAGLWVSCYVFDGTKHHVDLSTITVTNSAVTARNYPPEPRAEEHASGFRNQIEAGLFGRHLIGRWRNVNDTYFYGSLHFAVHPGEAMLDGYYTGFLSDSQVVAERWRWVRVEPSRQQVSTCEPWCWVIRSASTMPLSDVAASMVRSRSHS